MSAKEKQNLKIGLLIIKELNTEIRQTNNAIKLILEGKVDVPYENKISIVKNLKDAENAYLRNIENLEDIKSKSLKKGIKKLEKYTSELVALRFKLEGSLKKGDANVS